MSDLFKFLDSDENTVLTLTELLGGYLRFFESIGVKIKTEFKQSISHIAEMIQISNNGEIILPKCNYY